MSASSALPRTLQLQDSSHQSQSISHIYLYFQFLAEKAGNIAALLTHFTEGLMTMSDVGPRSTWETGETWMIMETARGFTIYCQCGIEHHIRRVPVVTGGWQDRNIIWNTDKVSRPWWGTTWDWCGISLDYNLLPFLAMSSSALLTWTCTDKYLHHKMVITWRLGNWTGIYIYIYSKK